MLYLTKYIVLQYMHFTFKVTIGEVLYILLVKYMLVGLRAFELRNIAYELAERNKKGHQFNHWQLPGMTGIMAL